MKPFRVRFLLPAIIVILAAQQSLWAHAFADHSEPRVGATVSKPPADVRIWFTQEVEPAFSRIEVVGPDGKEVDKKDTHVDPSDHHVLIVSLPALPPGTYKVHWHVVSVDTHHTQNDFKFVVKP
ncbi:MAG TPA: copper resistance protein CopC [Tepidisphaeraceae bacterium]|jgi:methionine-rich copper-binding protein CopC|nr:copper resistance protein CopC [Tepidisphaeraceae bacterium]